MAVRAFGKRPRVSVASGILRDAPSFHSVQATAESSGCMRLDNVARHESGPIDIAPRPFRRRRDVSIKAPPSTCISVASSDGTDSRGNIVVVDSCSKTPVAKAKRQKTVNAPRCLEDKSVPLRSLCGRIDAATAGEHEVDERHKWGKEGEDWHFVEQEEGGEEETLEVDDCVEADLDKREDRNEDRNEQLTSGQRCCQRSLHTHDEWEFLAEFGFYPGAQVMLTSVEASPELNDRIGSLLRFDRRTLLWTVRLDDLRVVEVTTANLVVQAMTELANTGQACGIVEDSKDANDSWGEAGVDWQWVEEDEEEELENDECVDEVEHHAATDDAV